MDKMRKPSDLSYKNFFSYPIMVMALFQEYVLKPLVGILDFSTLERLNGEYVSPELLERRNDIVWRVNLKNNSSEYLVVILEFQSRPDNLMGFRIQSYSTLLFLDIGRRKRPLKKHPLPYVFPIVMYNGKTPWRIPLDAGSLFPSIPNVLKRYRPKQSYMLLDERYIPDDELKKRNGLVTQLIKLERAKSLDDLAPIFRRLEELLPDPEYASLNNMFTLWAGIYSATIAMGKTQ